MEERWVIGLAVIACLIGFIHVLWRKNKVPDDAVITVFEKNKFLGLWNVVARLPESIEQHLRFITEEYVLNDDGSINVITRAYHTEKNIVMHSIGKIKAKKLKSAGNLKVAYSLPIYFDYNILDIDDDYDYALVSGSSFCSLRIMSRDMSIPQDIKLRFLEKAQTLGYNINLIEWME